MIITVSDSYLIVNDYHKSVYKSEQSMLYCLAQRQAAPLFREGVMLMDFGNLVSLLGLLIAIANLAVDVITIVITGEKEKRPGKRSLPKD
jgi:hypothetical protein